LVGQSTPQISAVTVILPVEGNNQLGLLSGQYRLQLQKGHKHNEFSLNHLESTFYLHVYEKACPLD
jgi:hypothetical protein